MKVLWQWLALCTVLTGCSLHSTPAILQEPPLKHEIKVQFIAPKSPEGYKACYDGFHRAQEYMRSIGVSYTYAEKGYDFTLVCLPPPSLLYAMLVPSVDGLMGGGVGVVVSNRSVEQTARAILHESGHALGAGHSTTGIMVPDALAMRFATGFSQTSLKEMQITEADPPRRAWTIERSRYVQHQAFTSTMTMIK